MLHDKRYVAELVNGLNVCDPETALLPLQPPAAVQLAASVLDHVSVVDPLYAIDAGLALIVTVGIGGAAATVIVEV